MAVVSPRKIRMELFKYYYAQDQEYNLYCKGDSSEFT